MHLSSSVGIHSINVTAAISRGGHFWPHLCIFCDTCCELPWLLQSASADNNQLSLHREGTPPPDFGSKTSPYFDLSPLYGVNEMETSSIRMNDGRGTLWPDSFTEDTQRLDMLPDSVPALLVLWNRYHNVRSQS